MKWLLTTTPSSDAVDRYVAWVKRRGVASEKAGSPSGLSSDLNAYSALLLTGGGDVNPCRYGESAVAETAGIHDDRDELELQLIRHFMAAKKPVFGVCRGIQILNVALGGKLIQHIPAVLGDRELHAATRGVDARHSIRVQGEGPLEAALRGVREVNSSHHQAVDPDAVGQGLQVVAVSPAGIIEAVEGRGLASVVLAVQWHPERLDPTDPAAERLLDLMVRACVGSAS